MTKPGSGKALKGKRIVVDPGHGGKDSGALSASEEEDAQEKDIALDFGLRLARLLRAQGAEVAMTREDDTFIPLGQRSQLANDLGADAFISIHCNSCATPNTLHGTAVYYDHEDSAALAQCVQQELVPALGSRDNGVRNANFSVIRRSQCPGILVETAFINHDEDRKLLTVPTCDATRYNQPAARTSRRWRSSVIRKYALTVKSSQPIRKWRPLDDTSTTPMLNTSALHHIRPRGAEAG